MEAREGEDGSPALYLLVDASSSGNIKPSLVMETFFKENGAELPEFSLMITRVDTFTNAGTEDEPRLVPLDAVGKLF